MIYCSFVDLNMRTAVFFAYIFGWIGGCMEENNRPIDTTPNQLNAPVDSIFFKPDVVAFIVKEAQDTILDGFQEGRLNGIEYRFSRKADIVPFFQKIQSNWVSTEPLEIGLAQPFRKIDVNGDNVKDLYFGTGFNAGGNSEPIILIYSTRNKRFEHHSEFDLPNIEYDSLSGLVRASWFAHGGNKWLYKPSGEQLDFQKGIGLVSEGDSWFLEYYNNQSGPKKPYKRIHDNLTRLTFIFEQALWDTSDH